MGATPGGRVTERSYGRSSGGGADLPAIPEGIKAVAELCAAECCDGAGAWDGPMQTCTFEPGPDGGLAASIEDASRGAQPLLVEG